MSGEQIAQHQAANGGDFAVKVSRPKAVMLTAGALVVTVLLAGGIWVTAYPSPDVVLLFLLVLVEVPIFVGLWVIAVLRLVSSVPTLVVSHEGITIDPAVLGPGLIKWTEIEALFAYKAGLQTRLEIVLTDPRPVIARQRGFQRLMFRIWKGGMRKSGSVIFADGLLPMSMDEVLDQIQRRYSHELRRFGIDVRKSRE